MITTQKSDYFLSEITRCGKDKKALFRVVDTLLHRRSKLVLQEHDDIQDILEMFGSFFSDKIQKIRQNLNTVIKDSPEHSNPTRPHQGLVPEMTEFKVITPDEVKKIVLGSPRKSCALDPIPTSMVKLHIDLLLPAITDIINLSLSSGVVPQSTKHALVTPLLKKKSLDPESS